MDPGPLEGPRREAAATNGAQRGARSRGSAMGKPVLEGLHARDTVQQDLVATSFNYNGVVSELQAKLDSGEKTASAGQAG